MVQRGQKKSDCKTVLSKSILIVLFEIGRTDSSDFNIIFSFLYRYFALGLLYHYNGQDAAALQVRIKLSVSSVNHSKISV